MARQPKLAAAFWEDLAFRAQQATEFAMKAGYHHHGLLFRYTHSIEELGTGLESAGIATPSNVKEAVVLTRYAVRSRYPGSSTPVTQEEHDTAVRSAERVVNWTRAQVFSTRSESGG